ncbi:hypothetical protein [Phytoactinopolyspora halotolerans]|uniref:Abi family protein n=1 Tax=Phytoactinopolyspora halotolerans TaxID=1981512 RepID=A0A6L9S7K7_9ACTN|nr:hypothetical protein [Phytoactinopolyspora halotolerans]NEE00721.1 hypothetical protein [Phytoactinopolyspora halotolerans]
MNAGAQLQVDAIWPRPKLAKEHGPGSMHHAGAEGQPGLSLQKLAQMRLVPPMLDATSNLAGVRRSLSDERLGPYDRAADGDRAASLELYEWNLLVSGAFFESLSVLEVALRNSFHEQLTRLHDTRRHPGQWYEHPEYLLGRKGCEEVRHARRRLCVTGKTETAGRVVAELSFGFWRYLTASGYADKLWRPALRRAFLTTRPLPRREIADRLTRLHDLRNRIAHHEPIHFRDLARDWQDILYIAEALGPDIRNWLVRTTRVPAILAARPHGSGRTPGTQGERGVR